MNPDEEHYVFFRESGYKILFLAPNEPEGFCGITFKDTTPVLTEEFVSKSAYEPI